MTPRTSRVRVARLTLLCGVLLVGPNVRADGQDVAPSVERFRYAPTGATFRVVEDESSGRKSLVAEDGRSFASVEEAVAAEEGKLPSLRRIVAPELWKAVEDSSRAGELVKVIVVLRPQPIHEIAAPIRAEHDARMRSRFARLRDILGAIASRRTPDPDGTLQLGDRIEEEDRLLGPAERDELRRIREEVKESGHAMRAAILAAARPLADADQAVVTEFVERTPRGRVLGRSVILSAVAAELPAGRVAELVQALPSVACVRPDAELPPALTKTVPNIGAQAWTHAGYDGGSGVGVAVLDTGVDDTHPALDGHVVSNWFTTYGAGVTDDVYSGHGTHIAGIIASSDATYRGVAPGATVFNGRSGAVNIDEDAMMRGGDWAIGAGADVLNFSVGGWNDSTGGSGLPLYGDAATAELGVSVAAACGNYGTTYSDPLAPASTGYNSLAVAWYQALSSSHANDSFNYSSRGPTSDGRRKPDLAAPGTAYSTAHDWEGSNPDWAQMGGTSMAAPHVAGALALLYDYGASWRPEGMKALLLATVWSKSPYPPGWSGDWGWGGLDVANAYTNRAAVQEQTFTASGPSVLWLRGPALAAGSRVALAWNRQVTWNGPSSPTSYKSIVDLDLAVYDDDGRLLGSSATMLDSVERVTVLSAVTATWIKVTRSGAFPSGQSSVDWALASEGGATATPTALPSPPSLSCSLATDKFDVKTTETFTVDADVTNDGALAAFEPTVSLTLPIGVSLVSGTNPRTIATVSAGGTGRASWVLRADASPADTRSFAAQAVSQSFGSKYESDVATASVAYDGSPWGTLTIAADAALVAGPGTSVALDAHGVMAPVVAMRLRNRGEAFGEWTSFVAAFPWRLAAGTGDRGVEAQLLDADGRESLVFGDDVFSDADPPTGSFVLSGGAEYLMPWKSLTADVTADDGEGSGVETLRLRFAPEAAWASYAVAEGPNIALALPSSEDVVAEGFLLDLAGNASETTSARIRLVPQDATDLTAAASYAGTLRAHGVGGSFRIGMMRGDVLSVRLEVAHRRRTRPPAVGLDLWEPGHDRVASGRYPEDARHVGIRRFVATSAGEHWMVVRPAENLAEGGVRFTLHVGIARKRAALHRRGSFSYEEGRTSEVPFDGVNGMVLSGVVAPTTPSIVVRLLAPDGTTTDVAMEARGRRLRIRPAVLERGPGTYRLQIEGGASFRLDLRPPRRTRLREE